MLLRRLLYPFVLAPATEQGALDAMNAALESQGTPPPAAGEGDGDQGGEGGEAAGGEGGEAGPGDGDGAADGAAAGEGAAGEPAGDDGAAGGEGGQEGGEGAAAAEGAQAPKPGDPGSRHRADGTFKSKEELERDKDAIAAAAKPSAAGKPPASDGGKAPKGGKKVDHVNDPIPDEIQGRTRTRIEGLVATAKELNTKLEAQTAELESGRELFGMIEATGADAATFARHMDVLAAMCSPDPAKQLEAVKLLRAAADKLGQDLGEPKPGADPLEGHQDLIDEVDSGEITRKRAEEIAKSRNTAAAADKRRTEATTRNNEQQAAQTARQQKIDALNALSDELRKKDGAELYKRKHAILVPFIRRLNPALSNDQVVAAVREAYNELKLGPAAKPGANGNRAPAGTGGRQPARALQGAGAGGTKAPSSALEAMNGALEEHARTQGRVA